MNNIYWISPVVILCVYWGVSLILFYNPTALHKKKKTRVMTTIRHISHRGGCSEFPENTISAFMNAVNVGTEMLELDLHLTKDNKVVVMHDDDLYRVTSVNERVSNLNYDELPKHFRSSLNVPFPTQPGELLDTDGIDTHIPTLEEVFQTFPHTPINIDLKQESDLLIDLTYDLIKKYNREDLVIWGSFRESTCLKAFNKGPEIPLLFSAKAIAKLLLYYYTGLLPFIPLRQSFLEIPVFTPESVKSLGVYTTTRRMKIFTWLIQNVLVSKRLFKHLNKRGISVFSWVQNTEDVWDYCFANGVNGVMTDNPTKLAKYLKDRDTKTYPAKSEKDQLI